VIADNAQLQALRVEIQAARRRAVAAAAPCPGTDCQQHRGQSLSALTAVSDQDVLTDEGETGGDPFSGLDTPTHGAEGAAKKLCMVCMDQERGNRGSVI
jgi:hypothetical protein